ncbi:hypothetical protein J6590_005784 [Homalodisca vitripennis]|nr:hypothetical protein J6590_005784 [Homalodisca vitripennis]
MDNPPPLHRPTFTYNPVAGSLIWTVSQLNGLPHPRTPAIHLRERLHPCAFVVPVHCVAVHETSAGLQAGQERAAGQRCPDAGGGACYLRASVDRLHLVSGNGVLSSRVVYEMEHRLVHSN